ncbi:MAG TPA: hypothetical protein EYG97_01355 [Arcobacter sp.]|nr:hypothetical protein [Arcobacter sp.]HIP55652.1 hypothetical protein [Arcobacter sp.]
MKIIDFIDEVKFNCSEIAYLSTYHILNKIYDDVETQEENKEILLDILENYSLVLQYLNDYAGPIYRRHNSSTKKIYDELSSYFGFDTDNKYTFEHIVKKLKTQTPSLIMSLEDDEIKLQTIENFEEKLEVLTSSKYYTQNKNDLEEKINKLQKNISLVRRASNF